jgi:hypothetical protein
MGRDLMTGPGPGARGTWPLQEEPAKEGRGTMERPGQPTPERPGVCASARQLGALWAGDQREATVRTGRGQAHRPGWQGGPAETWTKVA